MHFGGDGGGRRGFPVHFLFIIQKNRKSTRARPILKSNSILFPFRTIFPRMNNKKFTKRGPKGAPLPFLYEASLLTPGIFLIQIININNTNMYVIRIYIENMMKIHFPNTCDFRV